MDNEGAVYCTNCDWQGDADELVDDNDDGNFGQCPKCGSTAVMPND